MTGLIDYVLPGYEHLRLWCAGIELGLTETGINRFEIADRRGTRRHCGDGGGNGVENMAS